VGVSDWLQVSVRVDGEAAEAVSAVLGRYGRGGAVIERVLASGLGAHDQADEMVVKAYLPVGDEALRLKVEEAIWHLGQIYPIPKPVLSVVAETDWAEAWKAHYSVLPIGARTVIVPRWQSYAPEPDQVVITLDPGMAFGTGTHPTTRLCLVAMEDVVQPGMRVLDLGTGSGVLAIAAAKEGAALVLAVDIDEIAVASARDNVAANDVADRVQVAVGSLDAAVGRYDLILVNILAEVICDLLEAGLATYLVPGGTIVASGIIDEREADVRAVFGRHGFEVVGRLVERDWVALICRSPAG